MLWALLGIIFLIVCVVLIGAFLFLQGTQRTLTNALSLVERVHTNDGKRIDTILDRLMAIDFESFKNWQMAESDEEGGIEEPDLEGFDGEPFARIEVPGFTKNLGDEDLRRSAEERALLLEDFPDELKGAPVS